jgi:hypothetical protein
MSVWDKGNYRVGMAGCGRMAETMSHLNEGARVHLPLEDGVLCIASH